MKIFHLPSNLFIFCCFCLSSLQAQTSLWTEPFDDDTQYAVTLGAEGTDGTSDYFFRTDGTNIGPTYTNVVGTFFAGQDIDDSGWAGSASPSQLQWTGISIANYNSLEFTGLWANALSGIDAPDYIIVEYQIDNGGYNKLLEFRNQGGFNSTFFEDTDFDGVGNGVGLTAAFQSFTKTIAGTGSSLDLQVTVSLPSGSEDFAMDELEITGIISSSETITTTNVTGPFCVNATNGASISVEYTTTGTFTGTFTAQLSDATGDFTSPTNIGTGASPIAATIPMGTASGTGYKIRVVNDAPPTDGSLTAEFEIINGVPEVTGATAIGGDMQATVDWILPTDCYDEILVVVNETAGIDFAPTGDGTAYTANTVYAGPDQVVYQGVGTTETVTALVNGTTYYFEIFVRQGTTWSTGVEVIVMPNVAPSCEDFTNFPETSSSYADGTFMGNDGSTWTYVQCRGDQDITSPTPMLRNSNAAEMTSGSITGGIGTLTFNYQQAFGTDVNMEVFVNNVSVGTVTSAGETGVLKMGSFTIDQPGSFTLSFKRATGGGQVLLDDVCWTSFATPPCDEPVSPPTALNLTADDTSISGDFTGTGDDGYLVVMSTMNTLSGDPMDATTYAVNDALGGGTVVAVGDMTTFTVTGLSSSTQYYFYIFAYDADCINGPDYLLTPLTGDITTTVPLMDCFIDDCNFDIVPVTQNSDVDDWSCATGGMYSVNGFCTCDDPSELWLISPVFDFLTNTTRNFKMDITENFDGSTLELMYATDYSGDPATASWVSINSYMATTTVSEDISTLLDNVSGVNFGIKYTATSGQSGMVSGFDVSNIVIEADDCSQILTPCDIASITTTNTTTCDDNMTPADGSDDVFMADVVVSFVGAPATGNLVLSGGTTASVDVTTITSPYTFTGLTFSANGMPISITATFDTDMACTLTNSMAHPGLSDCTPATIPWKEEFNEDGIGIVGGCTDTIDPSQCVTNSSPANEQWSIILGDNADLTALDNANDFFQTVNGTLVAQDLANTVVSPNIFCELCFLSEVIDISSSATDFSVELTAAGGFEVDDYADVYLIVDGNEMLIPNWNNLGDAMHTLVDDWGTQIVSSGAIVGNTLQIKVCTLNGAGAENTIIDNVCAAASVCRIADIAVDNVGTCDPNDPSILTDDFYTADVTVTFSTIPTTGTLDLTGDIVGTPPSVNASTLTGTSYTFVGVQLNADGTGIDLTAAFSADAACTYSETNVDAGMPPCCAVSIAISSTTDCDNNGTIGADMTSDDTFTAHIEVTYFNAPAMGNLVLSGDGFADMTVDVLTITSPYTFTLTGLPANGTDLNIMASFSEDMSCMDATVIPGVNDCSSTTQNGGLLINEVGDEDRTLSSLVGNPEYIELLVIGDAASPTLNVDISGWIIDDNNAIASEFGTTAQSNGCLRIKDGCFTNIPPGSIIVIYNAGEVPTIMPAIDEDDTNPMDNVYIIPSDSPCLEVTTDQISSVASYTTNTYAPTNVNSWVITMSLGNGSGDVVQTRKPDGSFYHGMAYIITGVPYPNFPNGNPSFTAGTNHNISYNCGNSTIIDEYPPSVDYTPGAVNNTNNATIVAALLDGSANYDELIGTDIPSGDCAALAIELLDFVANLDKHQVNLKWITANEIDNDYFDIEHSADGRTFAKIGTINSKGDSNTRQDYQFVHQNPTEGYNYYRLRQVDVNGLVEYSFVQTIFYKKSDTNISLYPVPVENILYVDFNKMTSVFKQITLINTNGQIIETIQVAEGTNVFELSLKTKPAGLYWLEVVTDTETVMKKVIKQ